MNAVFQGWIEAGDVFPRFDDAVLAKMQELCKSLEGKRIEMVIKKVQKNRSLNQNAYYWGVPVKMLAEKYGYETGDEIQMVHDFLASEFLTVTKTVMGMEVKIVRSTSRLSTEEFETYCRRIRLWASVALDFYIPEPNEVEIPEYYEKGS